jgi:hypothetical protein
VRNFGAESHLTLCRVGPNPYDQTEGPLWVREPPPNPATDRMICTSSVGCASFLILAALGWKPQQSARASRAAIGERCFVRVPPAPDHVWVLLLPEARQLTEAHIH